MPRKYLSAPVVLDPALGERQIMVVASDPTLDRTKDTMSPAGCVLDNYKDNPVVLASHDPTQPIGTATASIKNGRVEALIDFAPAGISAKADEYCGLAKAGVLRAVSVGFDPIEFQPNKSGGFDYLKWELMELSLVAVPANPAARIIARSFAPEGEKAADWKVGASRNLPVGGDDAWDGAAAKASIFDKAGFDGDSPDTAFARKGFLAYDASAPALKGSYKLPFAKMVGGRLTAMPSGVRAAASRLPGTDIPDGVKSKAQAVIDHYKSKMDIGDSGDGDKTRSPRKVKGMWELACLCEVMNSLGYLQSAASMEAEYEGDNSALPAMLGEAMQKLGDALIAMSQEEVTELLADAGVVPQAAADAATAAAPVPFAKAFAAARLKAGRALSAANAEHVAAIAKALDDMANSHIKAADLHDELAEALGELSDHAAKASDRVKALSEADKKPRNGGKPEDGEDDESGETTNGEADEDQELAFEASRRKRAIAIAAISPAP